MFLHWEAFKKLQVQNSWERPQGGQKWIKEWLPSIFSPLVITHKLKLGHQQLEPFFFGRYNHGFPD